MADKDDKGSKKSTNEGIAEHTRKDSNSGFARDHAIKKSERPYMTQGDRPPTPQSPPPKKK